MFELQDIIEIIMRPLLRLNKTVNNVVALSFSFVMYMLVKTGFLKHFFVVCSADETDSNMQFLKDMETILLVMHENILNFTEIYKDHLLQKVTNFSEHKACCFNLMQSYSDKNRGFECCCKSAEQSDHMIKEIQKDATEINADFFPMLFKAIARIQLIRTGTVVLNESIMKDPRISINYDEIDRKAYEPKRIKEKIRGTLETFSLLGP